MRGLGLGIGKILEPLGGKYEDVIWMHRAYPRVLKRLAKHSHFAEHGKLAELLADHYINGFMRGLHATPKRAVVALRNAGIKKPRRRSAA
jgi:hypothetical protein